MSPSADLGFKCSKIKGSLDLGRGKGVGSLAHSFFFPLFPRLRKDSLASPHTMKPQHKLYGAGTSLVIITITSEETWYNRYRTELRLE